MAGVFITGTGTDVGKTVFAKALYNHLTQKGLTVAYMKPVQTGVNKTGNTTDYQTVIGQNTPPLHENIPYNFAHEVSPHLAQRMEKDATTISMEHIVQCYKYLENKHNIVIVEGAGGACSPMDEGTLNIDLIALMEIPAIVVMNNKLGAIHSTIATLSAMHNIRREVSIMGFVANHIPHQHATDAQHQDARRHQDARHQDARHQDARHQDAQHQDAQHQDAQHATVAQHQDAQHATVARHQDNIQTIENFSGIPCIAQVHGTKVHGTKMHGNTTIITHGDKLFAAINRATTKSI